MSRFLFLLLLILACPAWAEDRGHVSTRGAGQTRAQGPSDPGFFYKFVRSFSPEGAINMWRGGQRPDLRTLLTLRGFVWGSPVYLRVFKEEGVIEAWVGRGQTFELFEIYPICVNSGGLGPKLKEGDGQAPEGFYEVGLKQLNPNSKYHLSFNMGYPNAYDRQWSRTGAALMIHGACASIGCYALTDANIEEVYGLVQADEDYGTQLQEILISQGHDVKVDNAGVSGDTTAGGLSRLEWAIAGEPKPSVVIVSLGANDMLRGIDPKTTEKNLRDILSKLKKADIPTVIYGMQAPLNLPASYRTKYNGIYPKLAEEFDIPLYPFFLEGVALNPKLNLEDGVHPTKEGIAIMAKRTSPLIAKLLKEKS